MSRRARLPHGGWRLALALAGSLVVSVAAADLPDLSDPVPGVDAIADVDVGTHVPVVLKPGEFLWLPELAPRGPVLLLVSLPEQQVHVYRNGVRIGLSTISTGKPGFETPTGVFSILQKKREHYSNLYDDAPMPFMQRLTWDGIALHAGRVPGYPASHGCVRLPTAFSEKLYDLTSRGMTVVIVDQPGETPMLAEPGLFPARVAPVVHSTPIAALRLPTLPGADYAWAPQLAPDGALSVVVSTRDQRMVVLRDGVEIGSAPVSVQGAPLAGTRAYVLLEGLHPDAAPLLPDRPRRRWLQVHGDGGDDPAALADRLSVEPAFAAAVYDAMVPGASLVVTDAALGRVQARTVLESAAAAGQMQVGPGSDAE